MTSSWSLRSETLDSAWRVTYWLASQRRIVLLAVVRKTTVRPTSATAAAAARNRAVNRLRAGHGRHRLGERPRPQAGSLQRQRRLYHPTRPRPPPPTQLR